MRKRIISHKNRPEKKLVRLLKKHSGRDRTGKISVRHQGGRQKRFYRLVDFKRDKRDMEATVLRIEYDPNRNANLSLVEYKDGERRYIIHLHGQKIGDKIITSEKGEIKVGNALPLVKIPIGVEVSNIELYPGKGAQLMRGAGTYATLVAKDSHYVHLKLTSREVRKVPLNCYAVVGRVGNFEHKKEIIGKAGRKRLMGIKPTVRGVAQHPNSHPHGGGEGRSGEGMPPKTPWGKPARGRKTRKKKKWSNKLIVLRRK